MHIEPTVLSGTHHAILKTIGEDSCQFFEHAQFHFSVNAQYPELFDLNIIRADGSRLSITSWFDEKSAVLTIGFGAEDSMFQRLPLKPLGDDVYEYQRDNLCFFIDGVLARIAEIESIDMSSNALKP